MLRDYSLKIYAILPDTHPSLRSIAEKVTEFSHEEKWIGNVMLKTMDLASGIGLAAPQVGIPKCIIVWRDRNHVGHIMYNPEFVIKGNLLVEDLEGCLSVKEKRVVKRSSKIRIKWQDITAQWFEREFSGIDARVIQHEMDHLLGILISDKE